MFCSFRLWSSLSNLMKIKWVLNIQPFYLQSLWNDSFMETTNKTLTAYFFLPCLKKLESCFRILFYLFPFLLILEWIDTCFWKCMFCLGLFFCDFIIEIVLIFSVKSVNTYLLCCLDCLWFCSLQIFKEHCLTLVWQRFIPHVGSEICLPVAKFGVHNLWLKWYGCHGSHMVFLQFID